MQLNRRYTRNLRKFFGLSQFIRVSCCVRSDLYLKANTETTSCCVHSPLRRQKSRSANLILNSVTSIHGELLHQIQFHSSFQFLFYVAVQLCVLFVIFWFCFIFFLDLVSS